MSNVITKYNSEQEEALIRSQTMLLINRNSNKKHIMKRVLKRFQRCIDNSDIFTLYDKNDKFKYK